MTTNSTTPVKESQPEATNGNAAMTTTAGSHGKTKVEKAQSYLGLVSTSIGIIGAMGTIFVWIAANVFVGDIEIKTDKPVDNLVTKVVDKKGSQGTYYGKHVQLMPGSYHLEIGVPDKKPTKHLDVTVQLWKGTVVPYAVPAELATTETTDEAASQDSDSSPAKKHWWQFWRKKDSK